MGARAEEGDDDSRTKFLKSLTQEEVDELDAMVQQADIYSRLVESIAPTVYGEHKCRQKLYS